MSSATQIQEVSSSKTSNKRRPTILCVDDEEGILLALRQQLAPRFGDKCEIEIAHDAQEALSLMDELATEGSEVAVVIADQIMPGMKGVELLEEISRRSPRTAKVLLTGQAGLDAVVLGINRAGLNHYLPKPWDEPDLRLAVENLLSRYFLKVENHELVERLSKQNRELEYLNRSLEAKVIERTRDLAEANARLAQLAVTDGLTGLYNHRYFHERLPLEIERANRSKQSLSLLMVDVDEFKAINDAYGHPVGDEILRSLARLLSEGRRANDLVARYGGEEFALLLVDTPKLTGAQLAERLRMRVSEYPFSALRKPGAPRVTISIGVAALPDDAEEGMGLVRSADKALYRAKNGGRNVVVLGG